MFVASLILLLKLTFYTFTNIRLLTVCQLVWMGWQSIWIVDASACVIFSLHQKIQKMAKCAFWYQLTRVVPDKVQRAVKWLCVCSDKP